MSARSERIVIPIVVAAFATAGGVGCKKKSTSVTTEDASVIESIPADVVTPISWTVDAVQFQARSAFGNERGIPVAMLAERLGKGIRSGPHFSMSSDTPPASFRREPARVIAQLGYDIIDTKKGVDTRKEEGVEKGVRSIVVTLEVGVLPQDRTLLPLSENIIVERTVDPTESDADIDKAIVARATGAVDAAIDGITRKEKLRAASAKELEESLRGDTDVVLWSLDLIADRRETTLASAVIKLFRARDPQVAGAALTTAVALGDPSAVPAMTKLADFQDYENLRVLIEATSALGGSDAQEFLEFVATGHPNADLKQVAKEALERISK